MPHTIRGTNCSLKIVTVGLERSYCHKVGILMELFQVVWGIHKREFDFDWSIEMKEATKERQYLV